MPAASTSRLNNAPAAHNRATTPWASASLPPDDERGPVAISIVSATPPAWSLRGGADRSSATRTAPRIDAGFGMLVLAGLLVGLGTSYGSGCTSGHGVCGISRLSPRSLVATAAFMLAGVATVFVVRHVI